MPQQAEIVQGYQVLFRHLVALLKQERNRELTSEDIQPYLLSFSESQEPSSQTIFPSWDVRRQYVDAAFDLFNGQKYAEAKNGFYFLSAVLSDEPNVLLGLGACFLMEGSTELAKEHFEEAEQIMPENIQATVLKLRSYVELGMTPAAQSALYSALDDTARRGDEDKRLLLTLVAKQLNLQAMPGHRTFR